MLGTAWMNIRALIGAASRSHTVYMDEEEGRGNRVQEGRRRKSWGGGGTIKEWYESREGEERREGGRERRRRGGGREGGREAERKGDVTSNRQPMRVREGERESGRRRVCFSITAASTERRGAQSIS